MDLDTVMIYAAVGTVGAACIVALALTRRRREVLLLAIGFAGALELQVARVHAATLLVGLLVVMTPRATDNRRHGVAMLTGICALLLACTALLGYLPTNRLLGVQLLLLAGTAATLMVWCSTRDVPLILRGLLAGVTVGSAIAVLQNLGALPATYFLDSSGIPRVHSIYREPDFLAAFAAIGVVLAYRLVVRQWLQLTLIAVNGVALVYTFARASWLALIVSALAVVAFAWVRRRPGEVRRSNKRVAAVLVVVGGLALLSNAELQETVVARIDGLTHSSGTDYAIEARERQIETLAQLGETAPWHGHGLSTAGRVSGFGRLQGDTAENSVATNWILGWWVDGKYLAVPLIALFMVVAYRRGHTVAGQGLVLVLVNSLFSNLLFFPLTWVLLALADLSRDNAPEESVLMREPAEATI